MWAAPRSCLCPSPSSCSWSFPLPGWSSTISRGFDMQMPGTGTRWVAESYTRKKKKNLKIITKVRHDCVNFGDHRKCHDQNQTYPTMPLLKINTVNICCRGFQVFSRYTYFNVLLTLFCNTEILCPTFLLLICRTVYYLDSGSVDEESAYDAEDPGSVPQSGRPLEKEMATHSSILAWEIPWTEEPSSL